MESNHLVAADKSHCLRLAAADRDAHVALEVDRGAVAAVYDCRTYEDLMVNTLELALRSAVIDRRYRAFPQRSQEEDELIVVQRRRSSVSTLRRFWPAPSVCRRRCHSASPVRATRLRHRL